jgi:excisionase family DNA binding protein
VLQPAQCSRAVLLSVDAGQLCVYERADEREAEDLGIANLSARCREHDAIQVLRIHVLRATNPQDRARAPGPAASLHHVSAVVGNSERLSQRSQSDPEPLLTAAEVAALFKVTTRTVWRWAHDGRLERIRIGSGVTRFTAASVAALLNPTSMTRPGRPGDAAKIEGSNDPDDGDDRRGASARGAGSRLAPANIPGADGRSGVPSGGAIHRSFARSAVR